MFKRINRKGYPKPIYIGSAIVGTIGLACLSKELVGGETYKGKKEQNGKIVIVTGANTGIGKEVTAELARRGAKVYMACRDMNRCEATRKDIVLDTGNKYVYCRPCDLASLKSISNFATIFKKEEKHLDVLINNAGVMRTPPGSKTADGFESQIGVNHLGHFLLTNLLLDVLKDSAPSRIINVSSVAHQRGRIKKDDFNSDKSYDPAEAYAQSKLANILFTRELANRLQGTGVTVNAVHPGIVDTDITRHMSFYKSRISSILIKPFLWPFIKDSRQGAQTVLYLALDPEVEKVSGKYFCDYKEEEISKEAQDEEMAKWLWKVSEKWTKLTTM
ncbi:retinol dehydrogenase 13-like [Cylas formicarius]|uniref:retinol dehydrogenase 13-like n=1 Tax=Cylas formicarius TaxID=197179 RepID=UPI002958CEBA|nr:retinol dehydrogenase 13-like [Cylas formicarius]